MTISDELKNLVETLGGLVIVEGGQPKFVLVSYKKFKELNSFSKVIHKNVDNNQNLDNNSEEELVEKLNKEILALREEVAEKEKDAGKI